MNAPDEASCIKRQPYSMGQQVTRAKLCCTLRILGPRFLLGNKKSLLPAMMQFDSQDNAKNVPEYACNCASVQGISTIILLKQIKTLAQRYTAFVPNYKTF